MSWARDTENVLLAIRPHTKSEFWPFCNEILRNWRNSGKTLGAVGVRSWTTWRASQRSHPLCSTVEELPQEGTKSTKRDGAFACGLLCVPCAILCHEFSLLSVSVAWYH